jgi:formylmethanofuran dehydrogenase subunit E
MDLKITVKIKLEKPFTCIIDGLQCSTFATLGKRNMIVKKSRVENINVFVEKNTRKYIYKISKKAMDICLTAKDLSKAAEIIFKTQTKNLWGVS